MPLCYLNHERLKMIQAMDSQLQDKSDQIKNTIEEVIMKKFKDQEFGVIKQRQLQENLKTIKLNHENNQLK